jgi:hypothetical protein
MLSPPPRDPDDFAAKPTLEFEDQTVVATADELVNAFRSNPTGFVKEYGDFDFRVTGVVEKAEEVDGGWQVWLANGRGQTLKCLFEDFQNQDGVKCKAGCFAQKVPDPFPSQRRYARNSCALVLTGGCHLPVPSKSVAAHSDHESAGLS